MTSCKINGIVLWRPIFTGILANFMVFTALAAPQDSSFARAEPRTPAQSLAIVEESLQRLPRDVRGFQFAFAAKLAFDAGDVDKAEAYARGALEFALTPTELQGQLIYYGNQILGLIALSRGQIDEAKERLSLSAKISEPWKSMNAFGPNMRLAKELSARKEFSSVANFLEHCSRFWPEGAPKLNRWKGALALGVVPDFSDNLFVF